ncbi:MAG: FumA C-terminus/TtdB family hydratase beta subunit [Deltaproteobacteria bacterium]|jgi:fumarate hydratase subunit beta|nr:FumA C-terminus/TtdB family hydratase beta subunit [Deltaproteobacteria bacterium]
MDLSPPPATLAAPVDLDKLKSLATGQEALIDGQIYAARDQAHRLLVDLIKAGQKLPFDPQGQIIYYVGPSPPPPGQIIGAAGPTTSGRMDHLTEPLLAQGIKVMVGKGRRSPEVKAAMLKYGAIYLAAVGGAGAIYSGCVTAVETIAWPELGPEALLRLTVKALPAIVINDLAGGDLYDSGPAQWRMEVK